MGDFESDLSDENIKLNATNGTWVLAPGKYVIKAEGSAHYVQRHIIQLRGSRGVIKLNGTPQLCNQNTGYSTSTSRFEEHVVEVKQPTELSMMWWCQLANNNGACADKTWPYSDLGHTYVASVVVRRI